MPTRIEVAAPNGSEQVPLKSKGAAASSSSSLSRAPLLLVAGAVIFNLVSIRAERTFTPMLNDGSVHAQMVRAATASLRRGQIPLTSWFPYLGLGSPQFLHYQSLGAMVTGAAGLVVGPNRAFSWSLYLLLSLWPISIYFGGRLFGCSRQQAAVAAACAPFLFSDANALSVGYEPGAYLWIGYGLWSQLFAMWTLPVAWGASWRYVRTGKYQLLAILATSATIAAHFMTGYLAVGTIVIWVALARGRLLLRLRRGAVFVVGVALCSAWVVYPVISLGKWTSQNEFLQHSPSADSYGATQVLRWLVTGNLFDAGRFPVLTIFAGVGLVVCLVTFKKSPLHRAIVGAFSLSLLLFFGRPTLGPVIDLLPGSHDLFLRRFLMGVQLSALLLAGVGAIAIKNAAVQFTRRHNPRRWEKTPRLVGRALAGALFVAALAPAWTQIASYDASDATDIALQQASDSTAGGDWGVIVTQLHALGPGRVYAGMPSPSWGGSFKVGQVPVFKYLSNLDFDVVGYTLRTASLMTDPEAYFDENNSGDYSLFGIKYLVLPAGRAPVPRSTLILRSGIYDLWQVDGPDNGYVEVASSQGTMTADRTDIGSQSQGYLSSALPSEHIYQTVAFAGTPPAVDTIGPTSPSPGQVGSVTSETDRLNLGRATARIVATVTAVVVLKVSFDPGWRASVDGVAVPTYMVSPAMVAVTVARGSHTVAFQYHGFDRYPELFGLMALTILVLIVGRRSAIRRRTRR